MLILYAANAGVLTERNQRVISRFDHVVQHRGVFLDIRQHVVVHQVFVELVQVLGHVLRLHVVR